MGLSYRKYYAVAYRELGLFLEYGPTSYLRELNLFLCKVYFVSFTASYVLHILERMLKSFW